MLDIDKVYKEFTILLQSFTSEDLEEWLEFDRKRLEESKRSGDRMA